MSAALTLSGAPVLAPLVLAAQTTAVRVHVVQQILFDGRPVGSADVTVKRGGRLERSLQRGETIPDGTRIDVPAQVTVVVVSSGAKSKVVLNPGSSVTFVSTGRGELVSTNGGAAVFSVVPKTLDFFRVQSGEVLTASVHGTEFSVDAHSGSVTFACTQGEVNITKTGYLVVGNRRLKASLIDVISAANRPQATYHPTSTWSLAKFANFAQAEAFYQQRLAEAKRSGDANTVNVARLNLGNVQRLRGRYAGALKNFAQALAFYRSEGDGDRQAGAIEGIGLVIYDEDRYAEAFGQFQQALALFQQVGDIDG
ncbi:MAG TPA: FecR domain-containing protein, partial [Candidatus Cybelea sp.]|nr:FecR domain-containing protein [Candidatus Cybelea sp.]